MSIQFRQVKTFQYSSLFWVSYSRFTWRYPSFKAVLLHSNNARWYRPTISLVFNENSFLPFNMFYEPSSYYSVKTLFGSFHMQTELSKSVEWLQRHWYLKIFFAQICCSSLHKNSIIKIWPLLRNAPWKQINWKLLCHQVLPHTMKLNVGQFAFSRITSVSVWMVQ